MENKMDRNKNNKQSTSIKKENKPDLITNIKEIHPTPPRSQREKCPENITGHTGSYCCNECCEINLRIDFGIFHNPPKQHRNGIFPLNALIYELTMDFLPEIYLYEGIIRGGTQYEY